MTSQALISKIHCTLSADQKRDIVSSMCSNLIYPLDKVLEYLADQIRAR